MKRFLFLVTGLAVGFMVGSWSPLGQMAVEGATGLLAKSDTLASLLKLEKNETPVVGVLSPTEIAIQNLAVSVFPAEDRTEHWQKVSEQLKTRLVIDPLGLKKPYISALTTDEQAGLQTIIAAFEEENRQIQAGLASVDTSHPDYHLFSAIYNSNNQWIDIFRLNLTTGDRAPTVAELTSLDLTLQTHRQKIGESTFLGQMAVTTMQLSLAGTTPSNDSEAAMLALFSDWLDSYALSFDVEEALSGRITDFPAIMQKALNGSDIAMEAQQWDLDTQNLLQSRMQLLLLREQIKAQLAHPTS